jgi:hypothetical protein
MADAVVPDASATVRRNTRVVAALGIWRIHDYIECCDGGFAIRAAMNVFACSRARRRRP